MTALIVSVTEMAKPELNCASRAKRSSNSGPGYNYRDYILDAGYNSPMSGHRRPSWREFLVSTSSAWIADVGGRWQLVFQWGVVGLAFIVVSFAGVTAVTAQD